MGKREFGESTALEADGKPRLSRRLAHLSIGWTRYGELVRTWNARLNLTGTQEPNALAEILFADAVVLAEKDVVPEGVCFVDVGAGVGAPAIPLLLERQDLSATLVEPRRNRVAFLRTVIGTLGLMDRCRVLEQRLEAAPLDRAPFDLALSRATFAPEEWLRRAVGLAPAAVVMVAGQPLPPGARLERSYRLPFSDAPRALGVYPLPRT